MSWFSDIQRDEAIRICQLLIDSNRVDLIVPSLRQGMTLDDVHKRLATETAPVAPAARPQDGAVPRSARPDQLAAEVERAAAARFAAQGGGLYR